MLLPAPRTACPVNTAITPLVGDSFDWEGWERLIVRNGITIDRPHRSSHPVFPDIIYPIDYGYIGGTISTDGQEVDVFVGSSSGGLVATALTHDHRRGKREFKLLYRCTPEEIYLVNGFLNFDRSRLEAILVLRQPMQELWRA